NGVPIAPHRDVAVPAMPEQARLVGRCGQALAEHLHGLVRLVEVVEQAPCVDVTIRGSQHQRPSRFRSTSAAMVPNANLSPVCTIFSNTLTADSVSPSVRYQLPTPYPWVASVRLSTDSRFNSASGVSSPLYICILRKYEGSLMCMAIEVS